MVAENIFLQISLVVIVGVVVTGILRLMKQPMIIGYILTGILVSPYFLNLTGSDDGSIAIFAKIGVAMLLFMVGINLDPKLIKKVGGVAFFTGIGQIIFTFVIGFFIGKALGFSIIASAYIAIAVSFSSTIIIMKLLSDKNETESLYGRISIGFLIVQDFVAMIILIIISSFAKSNSEGIVFLLAKTLVGGAGLILALVICGIFILPSVTKFMAKSQELLLLFSLGWAFAVASLFYYFNFSIEIGALLAGITLSLSPYKYEINSRVKPIRDFFILIFFIYLGTQMSFGNIMEYKIAIIVFSLLILVGNPLIVMVIMGGLGYTKRNSFLAGLTVAQISEFSFIVVALGVSLGHISPEILGIMTAIGLVTMGLCCYLVLYSSKIYPKLSRYLSIFERKGIKVDEGKYHQDKDYDVILFGYNRIGYSLLAPFKRTGKNFLVVDYNPETIISLAKQGIDSRYGDASDLELLDELNLRKAKMVISTIPELEANALLIERVKIVNKNAIIIVISHQIDEAIKLYEEGADYVITPHFLGGEHTAALIDKHGFKKKNFVEEGMKNIKELYRRREEGHEHPIHHSD